MSQFQLYDNLKEQARQYVEEMTAPINHIIQVIINATRVAPGQSANELSMDDLYAMAIRLPAECAYLQSLINRESISNKVDSFATQLQVTNAITQLIGTKGDAKERLRRAEALSGDDLLHDLVCSEIVSALQQTIVRADKVYEGVRKIIDAKSREFAFDRKPGYPIG